MQSHTVAATIFLRLALAATFLSAVGSRLNLAGAQSSGWENFLGFTAEVNSFAPESTIPFLAIAATALEISFAILLLVGYKTKIAAFGTAILTLLFALAMAYSFGIKSPLDYSVFVDSASAFLLASMPYYAWSLDELLSRKTESSRRKTEIRKTIN